MTTPRAKRLRKLALLTAIPAITLIALMGLAVQAFLAVTLVHASDAGDTATNRQISQSEIIARAMYWVYKGYTYYYDNDTVKTAPDPLGTNYRKDCSGLVAMAWHLGKVPGTTAYDYDTGYFNSDRAGLWYTIPLGALAQGDAYVEHDANRHHMELFDHWKVPSDHSQGYYVYSFNNSGETVRYPMNGGFRTYSYLTSGFHAIRHNQKFNTTSGGYTLSSLPAGAAGCSSPVTYTLAGSTVAITERSCFVRARIFIDNQWADVFRAFEEIKWTGGGAGKLDGFLPYLDIQNNDVTQKEVYCASIKAQIDAAATGTQVCGYDTGDPSTGNWTADGWLHYDVHNDGKIWSMIYVNSSSNSPY
jgi:hypothetical protein